jgi:hypothetical protein
MRTGIYWGNLRERDHLEHLYIEEIIILKQIFKKRDAEAWTSFIWLRIRRNGGLANPACNAYAPYCNVICSPSVSTVFFDIIS